MRLLLDICTGIGLSASAGLRPFLPALVAGALAGADVTIDFDGTDFAFLESPWFMLAALVGLALALAAQRRFGVEAVETGPLGAALSGIGIALGGLLFAATLADHGYDWWPGLIAGVLLAVLGQLAVRMLFGRIRARADRGVSEGLVVYQDGGSFLGALLSILAPPVGVLVAGFLGWLYVGGRRRQDEKYAGLRILR
jgi:hypothetical protein